MGSGERLGRMYVVNNVFRSEYTCIMYLCIDIFVYINVKSEYFFCFFEKE